MRAFFMNFFLYGWIVTVNNNKIAFLIYFCNYLRQNDAFNEHSSNVMGQKPTISEVPSDVTNM